MTFIWTFVGIYVWYNYCPLIVPGQSKAAALTTLQSEKVPTDNLFVGTGFYFVRSSSIKFLGQIHLLTVDDKLGKTTELFILRDKEAEKPDLPAMFSHLAANLLQVLLYYILWVGERAISLSLFLTLWKALSWELFVVIVTACGKKVEIYHQNSWFGPKIAMIRLVPIRVPAIKA
jgi:hypothetical protein